MTRAPNSPAGAEPAQRQDKLDFAGRTVLVTGAASGIGRATARWLDAHGAQRLVLVDTDGDGLASIGLRAEVRTHIADVSDPELWTRIEAETGRLDHAVLNAGVPPTCTLIGDTPVDSWRRVIAINLDGVFLGLATAIRLMRQSGGGSIVLTSSVSALKTIVATADYAAAKAGIIQLARIAALEEAGNAIRVNAIAPGGVDTGIWDAQQGFRDAVGGHGGDRAATIAQMGQAGTPRGRWADPEELADGIGFLLSDMSANVTGAVLVSDGGISL